MTNTVEEILCRNLRSASCGAGPNNWLLSDAATVIKKQQQKIERLDAFGREFIYFEENPEEYKLMDEQIAKLKAQLQQFHDIVDDSFGVVGWHLNGDTALWAEFDLPPLQESTPTHTG